MFNFPTQPLTTWQTLLAAVKLYFKVFSKMWYLFFAYCFTTAYWMCGYIFQIIPANALEKPQGPISTTLLIFLSMGVLVSLLALYAKWVSMHRIYKLTSDPQITLKESLQFVKRKIITLFTNQVFVMLATLAFFVLLIVPGIILGVFLLLCVPLILFAEEGIISSIKKSCILVWGNFWHSLFVVAIPLAGMIPANMLINYFAQFSYTNQYGIFTKLMGAISMGLINGFILTPILWSAVLVLFNDLKLRK